MRKPLTLSFIALFILATGALAAGFPVIKRPIFGLNLGESGKALLEKAHAAGIKIKKDEVIFSDKDMPANIWTIAGAWNGNKAVKQTNLRLYGGQVYNIDIIMADSSSNNYEVLKGSLEKKYGKDQAGFAETMESKSIFKTTFDGQVVGITLNSDLDFTAEGGTTLTLTYRYQKMVEAVIAEYNRRKASKVEGDL